MENLTKITTSLLLFGAVLSAGCGGADVAAPTTPAAATPDTARELVQIRQENDLLSSRVRELEGRLSLSRAEARDLRAAANREVAPEREIVRIGGRDAVASALAPEGSWNEPEEEAFGITEDEDDRSPRPVLRLYGSAAAAPLDTSTPLVIPPPPPGIPVGLSIAELPAAEHAFASGGVVASSPAPQSRASRADRAAVAAYQQALTHLRDRQFDDALRAFDAFLAAHPRHPYASSAVYWQGEVYYAMRDYRHALSRFSTVIENYPRASKVADSMYKMGLCHKRMGREQAARRIFERVRRQFPDSVAARLSVQEDA